MVNRSKEYFSSLNKIYGEIIEETFQTKSEAGLSEMFQFTEDLSLWHEVLMKQVDTTLFISAIKEYEIGFQAAVSGQYRFAFVANRYFVEQICKFIFLSSNEYLLRLWKKGMRDVGWSTIIDIENGIFSQNYIRAFYPEVDTEGKHLQQLVSTLYRETSEFVHGNFSKIDGLPTNLELNQELLEKWIENVKTAKFIVIFLLCMRFSKDLNKDEKERLEDCIREELCGIDEFNLLFL